MRNEALEIFGRLGDRQGEAAALALEVPTRHATTAGDAAAGSSAARRERPRDEGAIR